MLPFFDEDHASLRAVVRSWVSAQKFPVVETGPDLEEAAVRLVRQLGQQGFLAYAVPSAFGGKRERVQARDLCILREELARGSALADSLFAVQALGSYPIALAAEDRLKRRYLPPVATGRSIAAFALTEPEAGSDVAALKTTAEKRENRYYLNGIKRFISNAGIADHYIVFASSALEKKAKGISAFIVDAAAPGLSIQERTRVLSPHPIGVIAFQDCAVDENAMLGGEGEGLKIAFATLDLLRCTVGAAAVGLAQRALEEAIQRSHERRQFGRAIGEFQGIQFKLADMATELEAARLLVYQGAYAHDCAAADAKRLSSMAKLYATETAQRVIDQGLQIYGGDGVVAGTIMERLYRDIRALRIYEGTSEIQKLVIARELLKATGNGH